MEALEQELEAERAEGEERDRESAVQQNRFVSIETEIRDLIRRRNEEQEKRKAVWRDMEALNEEILQCKSELEKSKQMLNSCLPRQLSIGLATVERIAEEKHLLRSMAPGSGSGRAGPGVYLGPLIDNFSLKNDAFRTAVEVAAGNSLFHVIVDTDTTAAMFMKELERRKAGRLTFLPLRQLRVEAVNYPDSADVRPLMEIALNYDPTVVEAIKQVCG